MPDYSHINDLTDSAEIWAESVPIAQAVSKIFARRYSNICSEDLSQDILSVFPRLFARFDPKRGTPLAKFLFFSYYRAAQDQLRRHDPLGITFPQRKRYPTWRILSEVAEDDFSIQLLIVDGLDRLDRGENLSE